MGSMRRSLRPEEDAYGQELWAHHSGKESSEIIERDDGYVDMLDPQVYFSEYRDWPPIEQRAVDLAYGRVLDIGCGAGRHSLYLQSKGLDVTGIDQSPLAIKVCGLRGLRKAEVMSIDDLSFPANRFDTILMLGNNFGLFGSLKKARRLLERISRLTSQKALIIAASRDPYKTSEIAHLRYHELNKNRDRMGGQLRIRVRFHEYATPWFDYLIVSKDEMKQILHGTTWRIREYIDSGNSKYVAILAK